MTSVTSVMRDSREWAKRSEGRGALRVAVAQVMPGCYRADAMPRNTIVT
jgi:hypothetical protein